MEYIIILKNAQRICIDEQPALVLRERIREKREGHTTWQTVINQESELEYFLNVDEVALIVKKERLL